jgi:hypothetical protein
VAGIPTHLVELGKSYTLDILAEGHGEIRHVMVARSSTARGIGMGTEEPLHPV